MSTKYIQEFWKDYLIHWMTGFLRDIRRRRRQRGWTIEDLAWEIGVDPTTIGRWERYKQIPHPRHWAALARALPELSNNIYWMRFPVKDCMGNLLELQIECSFQTIKKEENKRSRKYSAYAVEHRVTIHTYNYGGYTFTREDNPIKSSTFLKTIRLT